jgi:hypothetical protein
LLKGRRLGMAVGADVALTDEARCFRAKELPLNNTALASRLSAP